MSEEIEAYGEARKRLEERRMVLLKEVREIEAVLGVRTTLVAQGVVAYKPGSRTGQKIMGYLVGRESGSIGGMISELGMSKGMVTVAASSLRSQGYLERVSTGTYRLTDEGRMFVERGMEK